jgi:hypothetical protein
MLLSQKLDPWFTRAIGSDHGKVYTRAGMGSSYYHVRWRWINGKLDTSHGIGTSYFHMLYGNSFLH